MKYVTNRTITAYGILSQVSYKRDGYSYMHDIMQGNGAAPCIWVMLGSPLLEIFAKQGNGASLNLPDGLMIKVVAFAFMDDRDLIQKLPKIKPISALQHKSNIKIWDKGLRSILGAIVWEK